MRNAGRVPEVKAADNQPMNATPTLAPSTADPDLLHTLRALEVELHHPGVRCNAERLAQLMHEDFDEVGRSGRIYTRQTVTRLLLSQEQPPAIVPDRFRLVMLAPDVALLTYRSAHRQADGSLTLHTLRSSVWTHSLQGWQLRYHQGTPAAETWDHPEETALTHTSHP